MKARPPRLAEALRRASDAVRTLSVDGDLSVGTLRTMHALLSSAAHWVAEEMHDRLVADGVQRCHGVGADGARCSLPLGHAAGPRAEHTRGDGCIS